MKLAKNMDRHAALAMTDHYRCEEQSDEAIQDHTLLWQ